MTGWRRQDGFELRFEWGEAGVRALVPECRTIVVVDVLRFTTAVAVACGAGTAVYPYRLRDATATGFAETHDAVLADGREGRPSLSPRSLSGLRRVVLPSPNGSTCAVVAAELGASVVAASLRNASAVATALSRARGPIGVVACGERWPDGGLRPAIEDLLGAGAVIAAVDGARSPEASLAAATFEAARPHLANVVRDCMSGRELAAMGLAVDVAVAAELDAQDVVPVLRDGAFVGDQDRRSTT